MSEAGLSGRAAPDTSGNGRLPVHLKLKHSCVPGRARVHVIGLRGSTRLARLLEGVLQGHASISSVRASHLTGNVTVWFDKTFALEALLGLLRSALRGEVASSRPDDPCWHTRTKSALLAELGTHPDRGLSSSLAQRRLGDAGPNTIKGSDGRSSISILASQFSTLPVAVLAGAAVLSVATGAILEAVAIGAVLALNGVIGFVTESHAETTVRSLRSSGPTRARVIRDGSVADIPAFEVVPGDLLVLQRGTLIAADARIVSDQGLSSAEAMLTGESAPVSKRAEQVHHRSAPLAERSNMVYRGTIITSGSATAVVVATGQDTEAGRVQRLVEANGPPETPTIRQLTALGGRLAWLTGAASLALFLIGWVRGFGLFQMLRSALSLAVASVPEGLPMVATTTHAIGVNALRRREIFVRRLEAIETLACVNIVCFDKTGTLTQNRMSVAAVLSGDTIIALRNERLPPSEIGELALCQRLERLFEIGCLCSEVELVGRRGERGYEGSSTEVALVRCAERNGIDMARLRREKARLALQQRTETYRFMQTTHEDAGRVLVAMKGDPAEILARCRYEAGRSGSTRPLTPERRAAIERLNLAMAAKGLRVLGFAFGHAAEKKDVPEAEMTWLGAAGLEDPLRPGVRELMHRLRQYGLRTIMLTGDQCQTARAVADEIRLAGHAPLEIVDATRIGHMSAAELAEAGRHVHVFTRVSPAQKLRIVRALQDAGAVIAMVGDGINDSPALRAADVGLAMGRGGDAAAREAGDVFLCSDSLGCLAEAFEQGRTTHTNIRKSLRFILSTNTSEVLLMLAASGSGLGEGLSPVQLLWINVITDVLPGIGLALEPPDALSLDRGPQPADAPIIGPRELPVLMGEGAVLASGALLAGVYAAFRFGPNSPEMRTMMFGSLVASQLQHAIACRAPGENVWECSRLEPNPTLSGIIAVSLGIQAGMFFVPPLRRALGLAAIGPAGAFFMATASVLPSLATWWRTSGRSSQVGRAQHSGGMGQGGRRTRPQHVLDGAVQVEVNQNLR